MAIVGFNFSKLFAEQHKAAKGNLKISTNVKFESVEKTTLALGDDKSTLKVAFTYTVAYDPKVGSIELQGDLLFMQDVKLIEAVLAEWDKKKTLPAKVSKVLVNNIMQKCTIQALIMTKDIGLPPPMPLPKVKSSPVKVKAEEEETTVVSKPKKE